MKDVLCNFFRWTKPPKIDHHRELHDGPITVKTSSKFHEESRSIIQLSSVESCTLYSAYEVRKIKYYRQAPWHSFGNFKPFIQVFDTLSLCSIICFILPTAKQHAATQNKTKMWQVSIEKYFEFLIKIGLFNKMFKNISFCSIIFRWNLLWIKESRVVGKQKPLYTWILTSVLATLCMFSYTVRQLSN